MKDLVSLVRNEWTVLKQALIIFLLVLILAFGAAFVLCREIYTARLENLKNLVTLKDERIAGKDDVLDEYRERLHLVPASGSPFSKMTYTELKDRALTTVAELRDFIAQYCRQLAQLYGKELGAYATEEEQSQYWNQKVRPVTENFNEQYAKQFKIDSILLRDEILSRLRLPAQPNDERFFAYEHAVTPHCMGLVADDLEMLAKMIE